MVSGVGSFGGAVLTTDFILSLSTVTERGGKGRERAAAREASSNRDRSAGTRPGTGLTLGRVPGPLLVHRHPQNCPHPTWLPRRRRGLSTRLPFPAQLPEAKRLAFGTASKAGGRPQGREAVEGPQPSGPKDQNSPSWPGMADPDGPEQNRPASPSHMVPGRPKAGRWGGGQVWALELGPQPSPHAARAPTCPASRSEP